MSKAAAGHRTHIDQFFAGPGARADQWLRLTELAEAWAGGSGDRAKFEAALAEMTPTEEYHAYPGPHLLAALRDHAESGDASAAARLARRITRALLTRSYRQNAGDWDAHEDDETAPADVLSDVKARMDKILSNRLAGARAAADRLALTA